MSVLGLVMIISYIPLLIYSLVGNKARWIALNVSIFVALFNNLGTVVSSITFSDYAMYMLLIICVIEVIKKKQFKISKKYVFASIFLLTVVGIGIIYLISPLQKPLVLLMQTNMDKAYAGLGYVEEARFTYANLYAIIRFITFIGVLVLCSDFLQQEQYVERLMHNIYIAYIIFFGFATIEFLINNFVSSTIIRDFILNIIGDYDPDKTYYPRNRYGYYGFVCLYSEESYISMLLPFFGIVYQKGVNNFKEMLFFLWGSLVLLMSGCTTGLTILLFPILILARIVIKKIPRRRHPLNLLWIKISVITCCIAGIGIAIFQREQLTSIVSAVFQKVQTMIVGAQSVTSSEIMSADIRNYGNTVALNAFKVSPLFGVGIGTTRGYGMLTGFMATFGLLGIAAYLYFFYTLFGLNINKKKLLAAIYVGYLSTVLSVNFVYSFVMIPIFLLFSKQYNKENNRRIYVQS